MRSSNRLLATLAPSDLKPLGNALQAVKLPFRHDLQEPDRPLPYVYFPVSGLVSVVNEPQPGEIVEVATIGREGMLGLLAVLGASTMPSRAFIQIPGEGIQIETGPFMQFVETHAAFRALLLRYSVALFNQVAQNASCNRLHEVQERCARWLLQTHDSMEGDTFPLTHEFLGQMLGVHRPTVSIAARILQTAGLITYARGVITVLDRKGLEEASCSCYRLIAQEYARLLNEKPRLPPRSSPERTTASQAEIEIAEGHVRAAEEDIDR